MQGIYVYRAHGIRVGITFITAVSNGPCQSVRSKYISLMTGTWLGRMIIQHWNPRTGRQSDVLLEIAAVLGGGVFGDHCARFQIPRSFHRWRVHVNIGHLRNQQAYALVAGSIAMAGSSIWAIVVVGYLD